jgi:hypothetical protein
VRASPPVPGAGEARAVARCRAHLYERCAANPRADPFALRAAVRGVACTGLSGARRRDGRRRGGACDVAHGCRRGRTLDVPGLRRRALGVKLISDGEARYFLRGRRGCELSPRRRRGAVRRRALRRRACGLWRPRRRRVASRAFLSPESGPLGRLARPAPAKFLRGGTASRRRSLEASRADVRRVDRASPSGRARDADVRGGAVGSFGHARGGLRYGDGSLR